LSGKQRDRKKRSACPGSGFKQRHNALTVYYSSS
jgi:hypothetical protein